MHSTRLARSRNVQPPRSATGLADRRTAIFSNRGSAVYDLQIEINYTCTYRSLFLDTPICVFIACWSLEKLQPKLPSFGRCRTLASRLQVFIPLITLASLRYFVQHANVHIKC